MLIQCLVWEEDFDPSAVTDYDQEGQEHIIVVPTWDDVWTIIARLDSSEYPALHLYLQRDPYTEPCMSIYGGPTEYAVSLTVSKTSSEHLATEEFHYINPERVGELATCPVRVVGRSYHSTVVEEVFFTSDRKLLIQLVEHYCDTGKWHQDVPCWIYNGEWIQINDASASA